MAKPSAKRLQHHLDMVAYDRQYDAFGVSLAGMDEVGRGPLCGNVVTACVIMPPEPLFPWIDDSKKLSAARREEVYEQIMASAIYVGIGEASPEEIDQMNILNATKLAMERAAMNAPATLSIVDAVRDLHLPFPISPIIKGDSTSYNVAAASIVAKVTRDREMVRMAGLHPEYGFDHNMGYGTAEHIQALRTYGPTPFHRRSFIRNFTGEADA